MLSPCDRDGVPFRIREPSCGFVDDERIVGPRVPMTVHDLHELVGAIVARIVRDGPSSPMFCASTSFIDVTTFQAARPRVIRSSVWNRRATWNG